MTHYDHLRTVSRYEQAARCLNDMLRTALVMGNARAVVVAREDRDTARRLHLHAFADMLLAGLPMS